MVTSLSEMEPGTCGQGGLQSLSPGYNLRDLGSHDLQRLMFRLVASDEDRANAPLTPSEA